MNTLRPFTGGLLAFVVILAGVGCESESPKRTPDTTAKTNTASPTPPTPAPPASVAENVPAEAPKTQPVTLPVLDAFFAQEGFAAELKSKLQLTDEQVSKLKNIARQETSKLREADKDDQGTARATAARQEASEKIRATIGEEKTRELISFVSERWSGDVGTTTPPPATPPPAQTPAAAPKNADASNPDSGVVPKDKRIVVNAPAFRMDIFEDGKLIKSYKIGIGYPEFPLPTGLRKADAIIFNPTWTPPDEPWVESKSSEVKVGKLIEAGDKLNPLGPIKIPIGLPSLIHGGKSPGKIGAFASHGCVGLTNSQVDDFAKRLAQLSGTHISDEQISDYKKNKTQTRSVKLSKSVPVELRYDTITVEDGKLHIYRDVYDRGTNAEENLQKVLQPYGVSLDQLSDSKRAEVVRALRLMARDASGKTSAAETTSSAMSSKSASPKKDDKSDKVRGKAKPQNTGQVTRTIKGGKEVVIEIEALKGKGYPAPVDLDSGVAPKKAAARKKK